MLIAFRRLFRSVCRFIPPVKLIHLNFIYARLFTKKTKQMKLAIAMAPLIAFALLSSCGNRNAGAAAETAAISGSSSATSGADGVFSYLLQSSAISGGPVDLTQTSNIAYIQKSGQTTNMQFFLNDAYDDKSSTFAHSLRFAIPAKTGTTTLDAGQDNGHVELFVSKGSDGAYSIYGNEAFTVTVSNISSTRVSGTFSGKVKSISTPADELTIAEGKFDLPLHNTVK
jgi:hypothetical protein